LFELPLQLPPEVDVHKKDVFESEEGGEKFSVSPEQIFSVSGVVITGEGRIKTGFVTESVQPVISVIDKTTEWIPE
jgi:hypothetical protein